MRRSFLVASLMVTAFTVGAAAQTPAPAPSGSVPSAPAPAPAGAPAAADTAMPSSVGPAKIAVIAFQVAVAQTNEFQRAFLEVQKKFDPKRQALKALSDDIDTLTKQLQTQPSTLTEQEQATKARTLDEKKKQFDREQQDDQNDFQQATQELYSGTASKVFDVLSSYAQQHGYTLVLDIASQQTPVMYALPETDITKEIIALYNTKSGVPPPPAAAPAPVGTPKTPGTTTPKAPGTAKPPSK